MPDDESTRPSDARRTQHTPQKRGTTSNGATPDARAHARENNPVGCAGDANGGQPAPRCGPEDLEWWRTMIGIIASDPVHDGIIEGCARKRIKDWESLGCVVDADAEDLKQSAYLKAFQGCLKRRHVNGADPAAELRQARASLCAAIANEARNLARKSIRRARATHKLKRRARPDTAEQAIVSIDVARAVDRLSPKQRRAVISIALWDEKPAEHAEREGIAPSTARNNSNLGKAKLKKDLEEYRPPPSSDQQEDGK